MGLGDDRSAQGGTVRIHTTRRVLRSIGLALALVSSLAVTSTAADGPTTTVEPAGPLAVGTTTITVTGSGFDPNAANGNGIYVVFGPITPSPGYYMDPSIYGAFKWVSPGGADSPATAPLGEDGSFVTTLDVSSSFASAAGEVDCATTPCAVITFAAHGSPDRGQDTCTAITFGDAALGSPSAGTSPTVTAAAPATPATSVVPGVSPAPAVDDPCGVIGAPAP